MVVTPVGFCLEFCIWLIPLLLSEQASVAKVDKLCTKVAFKNVYVSGTLEHNLLQTCKGKVSFNVYVSQA